MDIHSDPQVLEQSDLHAAIRGVSFDNSCLDMGWQWQVRIASYQEGNRAVFGWLIRCSFQRPERDTGTIGRGFGRWWFIEQGATVSSVQKTMFAAAKMIVDHEAMEAFKVDGKRPFDPHRSVQDLITSGREGR